MIRLSLAAVALIVLAGCAPAQPATSRQQQPASGAAGAQPTQGTKRIVATTLSELRVFILLENFAVAGKAEVQALVHHGLTMLDENLVLVPRMAEAVPTVENGLWVVHPDGRMDTTWRIRDGARWHDGTLLTAEDLLFTAQVIRDRELGDLYHPNFRLIESAEAPDARTIKVTWRQPFIEADQLFGLIGVPLPRHLLEQTYTEDKASLTSLPYWSSGFVGTGPYRIKEWVLGSDSITLSASDTFVLGRPKIDEIEVRMITDNNLMVANILANELDVTMGRNMSYEQSETVRAQWRNGAVRNGPTTNPMIIYPSFLYSEPVIVRDVRFRRAVLQGINRQELADSLLPGQSNVAHSLMVPSDPDFATIDSYVVKYAYDSNAAVQAITNLGYTRGGDGMFRDSAGQLLSVEMRTTSDNEIHMKAFYPVNDYLKGIGLTIIPEVVPPARQRDVEYRAKLPGFQYTQGAGNLRALANYVSSQQKTAETGWRGNHTGYGNPEYDALVQRYFTTIPKAERLRVAGEAFRHLTDQLVVLTTFYNAQPQAVSNRLKNVPQNASTANIQKWDVN